MGDAARLFFAAWPAPEVQHALYGVAEQARRECGGRAIAARNMHLTLAFLGDVERARMPQLYAVAAAITGVPCELIVDRVEYWRHNRILWAGVEGCPSPLQALVADLSRALRAIGFSLDERPYVPHITLLRSARRKPARSAMAAVAWPVRDFALIESVQRSRERVYEVLRRWPLAH